MRTGHRLGDRLFRWRSFAPMLPLGAAILATAWRPVPVGGWEAQPWWTASALTLGGLGLLVRATGLGHVPPGTSGRSTRTMRADVLNRSGVYSLVRHPLYLGNLLLWLGVALMTGLPLVAAATLLSFFLFYWPVIAAEDRFLADRFGDEYAAWARTTPTLLPRRTTWVRPAHPFSLRFVLGRDYHALFAFVACTWTIVLVRSIAGPGRWPVPLAWWLYLGTGLLTFVTLHVLKRRTDTLSRP